MRGKWLRLCLAAVMILSLLPGIGAGEGKASAANAGDILLSHSFEDGTTQGWTARGAAKVEVTGDQAYQGKHSLQTTGRTEAWNGPSLSLTDVVNKNAVVEISGYVKLTAGSAPADLKFTVERRDGSGDTQYDQVNAAEQVTDQKWVKLQGQYSYEQGSGLQLYLESTDAAAAYLLDEFQIRLVKPAPENPGIPGEPGKALFNADFEDGNIGKWKPRGTEKLEVVSGIGHNSNRSLKTSSRTETYHGPLVEVLPYLQKGSTVHVSFWAMYDEGPASQVINGSLEKEFNGDAAKLEYATFASTTLNKGQWKKIEADIIVPAESTGVSGLRMYTETPWKQSSEVTETDTIPFYIDDVQITATEAIAIEEDIPDLAKTLGTSYALGAAIDQTALDPQDPHSDLLKKHFKSITAGNFMKMDAMQPTEGNFVWSEADRLVNFAAANDMEVRGHTLLWHSQVPDWFFTDPNDPSKPAAREQLLKRMKTHIQTIVSRYKGKVHTWDVVNEVISDGGGLRDQASNSKWRDIIGDVDGDGDDSDYIELAFRYAREADPDAVLVINDYGIEGSVGKMNDMVDLVEKLLAKGTPIDAIGFQMHVSMYGPDVKQIREAFNRAAALGVHIQVTELDMSIYSGNSEQEKPVTDEMMLEQAYRYRALFDLFKEFDDRGVMDSVTLWGLADDGTWLDDFPVKGRKDAPLLFDRKLKAKPAYWALVDPASLPVYRNEWTAAQSKVSLPDRKGQEDILWGAVKAQPFSHVIEGTAGTTGEVKTLWDGKKLNLRIEVRDATRFKGDQVEVFVSPEELTSGKKTSTPKDGHYIFNRDGGKGKDQKLYQVKENKSGYVVYASLPFSSADLTEGKVLSLDFRITDKQADGKTSIIVWNDTNNQQPQKKESRGKLKLGPVLKQVKVTYGTPVVDGKEDKQWKKAVTISTDVKVAGDSGAKAKAKLLWDEKYLYVLAHVTDPLLSKKSANAHEQDSIELFIDLNKNQTSSYEDDDAQYRVNFDNEVSYGGNARKEQFKSSARLTKDGYVIEAAIPLENVSSKQSRWVGFDLQVNDDGAGDGKRSSVFMWSDPSGNSYRDTSGFGSLLLVKK